MKQKVVEEEGGWQYVEDGALIDRTTSVQGMSLFFREHEMGCQTDGFLFADSLSPTKTTEIQTDPNQQKVYESPTKLAAKIKATQTIPPNESQMNPICPPLPDEPDAWENQEMAYEVHAPTDNAEIPPLPVQMEEPEDNPQRDWANSGLYKYILESHTRSLLDKGTIKLGMNETRPHTPAALKGMTEDQ